MSNINQEFDPKTSSYNTSTDQENDQMPITVDVISSKQSGISKDDQTIIDNQQNPYEESSNHQTINESFITEQSQTQNQTKQNFQQPERLYNTPKPNFKSSAVHEPKESKNFSSVKIDYLKYLTYIGIPVLCGIALFSNHWIGLLVYWVISLVGIKLKPALAWIVVLINILFLATIFPIGNYMTLAAIVLTILSALFLGLKPSVSKFNKFVTATIALIVGLWITVPMSQLGTLKYLQQEYSSNSLFKNSLDSLYIGAGSPKLSTSEIEQSFKAQISAEIANGIKDKAKLLPDDISKLSQLCLELGADKNLNQNCQILDKENVSKNIDSGVASQVENQTQDLKNQFNQYPQVQMAQHFLSGLSSSSSTSFWSSPYMIPGIVLFVIYAFLSGFLQLISWPVMIFLKRVSLS